MSFLLGLLAIITAYQLYSNQSIERIAEQGRNLVNASSNEVDWDRIEYYQLTGETDEAHEETLEDLRIYTEAAGAEYLFVITTGDNGGAYIYDTDTSEERMEIGEYLDWEPEVKAQLAAIAAGEEVDPIFTDGEYGNLISIYEPMYDSAGKLVGYMGVDYSVEHIVKEQTDFIQRLIVVVILIAITMTVLFVLLLSRLVIRPINQISQAAEHYVIRDESDHEDRENSIMELDINTKDELQSLSESLKRMVKNIGVHITELEDANERASQDSLTGLLNREAFRERVSSCIVNDHSANTHTFIMIDLDNFKDINDTYGHAKGDEVLIECARAIKARFRDDDLIARMGGDEFAVFYKNVIGIDDIKRRAEAIGESIRRIDIGIDIPITTSVGVAYRNARESNSYQRLYIKADEALYEAKARGRNTYVIEGDDE